MLKRTLFVGGGIQHEAVFQRCNMLQLPVECSVHLNMNKTRACHIHNPGYHLKCRPPSTSAEAFQERDLQRLLLFPSSNLHLGEPCLRTAVGLLIVASSHHCGGSGGFSTLATFATRPLSAEYCKTEPSEVPLPATATCGGLARVGSFSHVAYMSPFCLF